MPGRYIKRYSKDLKFKKEKETFVVTLLEDLQLKTSW